MSGRGLASILVACALLLLGLRSTFAILAPAGTPGAETRGTTSCRSQRASILEAAPAPDAAAAPAASAWQAAASLLSGVALGMLLLVASPSQASAADIEDTQIPLDSNGKLATPNKEELVRGKRLFNAACASCHVGGGTRTNQNVGLGFEELSGALPARSTVEGLMDYMDSPTTYDGLKDISDIHPSIKAADLWPKMRTMKQKDLYDISTYILYNCVTIPEKWGGGKQYY